MAHLSLNRRWRPRSFEAVTRQEHVTRTLRNAIRQGRLAQAYLFGGRRGTGKTTMARLLAMSLNCQAHDGPTDEPCGKCQSCAAIVSGSSPDVIELDAASNRGIDEIRALQENVRLSPMSGRYKVYIIDEAHQMTKDAYNAFLKTLEEPPPHVIFVLATTEPEKILPTVRSRCQRFDFRPVPEQDIAERLRTVARAENIEASDELLGMIARKAEGSLRDALGLLEQCVAFAGDKPTVEDFLTVAGGVDRDALRKLVSLVAEGRAAEVIATLDVMLRAGRDPAAIAAGLIGYLRDVFLTGLRLKEAAAGGDSPPDPELAADAKSWDSARLVTYIETLVKADGEMRYSPQPRLVLEMALLSLVLRPGEVREPGGVRPSQTTGRPGPTAPGISSPPGGANSETGSSVSPAAPADVGGDGAGPGGVPRGDTSAATRGPAPRPAGKSAGPIPTSGGGPVDLQWFRDNWEDLLDRVRKKSVFARAFLLKATPVGFADGVVTLAFDTRFHKEQMEVDKNRQACEEALSEAAGMRLTVRCRLVNNGGTGAEDGGSAPEPPPPPEEPLVPRTEPVRLPPPEKPQAPVGRGQGGYGSRSGSRLPSGSGAHPAPVAGPGTGPGARPGPGPAYRPAPGPGVQPGTGADVQPAAEQGVQPGARPGVQPAATPVAPPAEVQGPGTPGTAAGPSPPDKTDPPGGGPEGQRPAEPVLNALTIFGGHVVNGSKVGDNS